MSDGFSVFSGCVEVNFSTLVKTLEALKTILNLVFRHRNVELSTSTIPLSKEISGIHTASLNF